MVWYSHLLKDFPQFVVIHTVKGFNVVNEAEVFSWNSLAFSMIQQFDLFVVQGTFKSLLQHHSLKASILQLSAFLMVHLSNPYMTTGKIIALTIQIFGSKVMSLLLIHYMG